MTVPVPDASVSSRPVPTDVPSSSHSGGRGNRRWRRGGGRGGGRGHGSQHDNSQTHSHHTGRFEGREPSLKGHIYDYTTGGRNADLYMRTTKEVVSYVGRTYSKYTAELVNGVENLILVDPSPPAELIGNATNVQF